VVVFFFLFFSLCPFRHSVSLYWFYDTLFFSTQEKRNAKNMI
jgi:hypothetical protein